MQLSPKSIIFDYGGTIDSNGRHWAAVLWDAFQAEQIPITYEQFRDAYVFGERALAKAPIIKPTDDFHTLLFKKVRQELAYLHFKEILRWEERMQLNYAERIANRLDAQVLALLETVRPLLHAFADKYPMVLVSNFYGNIETILKTYRLDVFHTIVESAVVGVRKPDPEIFAMGVRATKCDAKEVVVIGDSYEKDIVPAHSLGCRTIWLKGEGWNGTQEIPNAVADLVISDFQELKNYL